MFKSNKYIIRRMTAAEVKSIAIEWAAEEGWNPGLYDAECFYAVDPNGFYVGLIAEKPVSCISVVSYGPHFGFLGFYIVHPDYRGKGMGIKLWNTAIEYLKHQNIGLDGVVSQQHNYKASGFELAYRNIRYEGIAQSSNETFGDIVPVSEISFEKLVKYDSTLFSVSRPKFLQCWVNQPESKAFAAVSGRKLKGYGVIRKCRNGYKIGPLFADTPGVAHALFSTLTNHVSPGDTIYLDVPEVNTAAIQLAESNNMNKVFETARMYTKYKPDIELDNVYGVTSFELG